MNVERETTVVEQVYHGHVQLTLKRVDDSEPVLVIDGRNGHVTIDRDELGELLPHLAAFAETGNLDDDWSDDDGDDE